MLDEGPSSSVAAPIRHAACLDAALTCPARALAPLPSAGVPTLSLGSAAAPSPLTTSCCGCALPLQGGREAEFRRDHLPKGGSAPSAAARDDMQFVLLSSSRHDSATTAPADAAAVLCVARG